MPGSRRLSLRRNEIASCEETAYESLPFKDAATLLFFQKQSELLRFAEQVKSVIHRTCLDVTRGTARVASQPIRVEDTLYEEGRGGAGHSEGEAHRSVIAIRARVGADRVRYDGKLAANTPCMMSASSYNRLGAPKQMQA
jgi:hypothetical protein